MIRPPATLSNSERRAIAAVCETMFPRLEPGATDNSALFALGARDVHLAAAMEQAVLALNKRQRRALRLFLTLLRSPLFNLAVTGRAPGIGSSDAARCEDAMLAMADSRLAFVRSGYQALKRLATFLFYTTMGDARVNLAAASLGYEVPLAPRARSPLAVTRVSEARTFEADVCVVGSGAGGGVAAAQVAAAGRTVVVLEAGPPDQAADFDQREIVGVQRLYLDQGTTATRDLGVAILAGSCIGGGTSINWQTSLRMPDYIRDEWAEQSGVRAFAGERFTRALDVVSERAGVGTFQSVRNANNESLELGCAALGYNWTDIPRNARGCDLTQCGFCVFGCRVGGKQSTANTFLLDAQRDGRTTIVASCRAERLWMEGRRVVGVQALASSETDSRRFPVRVRAGTIVVAAGALETPAFLMRSGIEHPQLGRNLYLHPTSAVAGRYEAPVRGWIGAPQTVVCDEFARVRGNYGYRLETAPVHPGLIALALPWYGARDHRERMQHAAHVSAFIALTRDRHGGRVSVDSEGRPVIHYRIGRMERALLKQGIASAARVHWAAGADEIHTLHTLDCTFRRRLASRPGDIDDYCEEIGRRPVHGNRCGVFSAHQMGTCRMGIDPKTSVCDERGRVRGVPGLYVADASLFPTSSGVNPMITVMAMAYMVGAEIAKR